MDNSEFEKEIIPGGSGAISLIPLPLPESKSCEAYKARIYGKWIFLKTVKAEHSGNSRLLDSLRKEMEVGFQLDHPNLPRYVVIPDLFPGRPAVAMELIEGLTLDDFVATNPDYFSDPGHVTAFIRETASALDYLHSRQILHLDLKPGNLMITKVGSHVKLIDLGCCATDAFRDTAGLTKGYQAPERMACGAKSTTDDFYGLGKLLEFIRLHTVRFPESQFSRLERHLLQEDPAKRISSQAQIEKMLRRRKVPYAAAGGIAVGIVALLVAILLYVIPGDAPDNSTGAETVKQETAREEDLIEVNGEENGLPIVEPIQSDPPRKEPVTAAPEVAAPAVSREMPQSTTAEAPDPDRVLMEKLMAEVAQNVKAVYGRLGAEIRNAAAAGDYSEATYKRLQDEIAASFKQLMAIKQYQQRYPSLDQDLIGTIVADEMQKQEMTLWLTDWNAYDRAYTASAASTSP